MMVSFLVFFVGDAQFLHAVGADLLGLEGVEILGSFAEGALGLYLPQMDLLVHHTDLHGVVGVDVQTVAKLHGKHDASQFIDLSDHTGVVHTLLFLPIRKLSAYFLRQHMPTCSGQGYYTSIFTHSQGFFEK